MLSLLKGHVSDAAAPFIFVVLFLVIVGAFFDCLFLGFMLPSIFNTALLVNAFPGVDPSWLPGSNAVLWKAAFPTMFSLTFTPLTTGSCTMSAIVLLTILSSYERKSHYLPVFRTKSKLQKQKINAPAPNVKTEP